MKLSEKFGMKKVEELPEKLYKKVMFPDMLILNTLEPGSYFGEISILSNSPSSASIYTT